MFSRRAVTLVCSWCGRMRQRARWGPPAKKTPHKVSHGICPDCIEHALEEAEAAKRRHAA